MALIDLKLRAVKILIFSKFIYRYKAIPTKNIAGNLVSIAKISLKFIWKCKGIRMAKTILKQNKTGRISLPDSITYVLHNYSSQDYLVILEG